MANSEEIMTALRNAHEAGDTESAARLARMYQESTKPSENQNAFSAIQDLTHHIASSVGAGVVGGAKELYSLATGHSAEEAAQEMRNAQRDLTHQAQPNSKGDTLIKLYDNYSPVGNVVNAGIEKVKSISPKAGTAIEGTLGVSPLLGGTAGLIGKLRAAKAPVVEAAYVAPEGSAGAAATSFANKAQAANIAPEIHQAISAAEESGTLNKTAAQRHIEAHSLPVPVDLTAGQAMNDLHQLSYEQNMRGVIKSLADRFNEQNGKITDNLHAIHDNAAPDIYAVNHVESGQNLIDHYKEKDAALKQNIAQLYQNLRDSNGGEFPLDAKAFVNNANSALKTKWAEGDLPLEWQNKLETIQKTGTMPYGQFEKLRSDLAEAQREHEAGLNKSGRKAYALGVVRNELENFPMTTDSAPIKALADKARGAARERFQLIDNDPAYAAAVYDKVAPDDFINKFVIKGKVGDVRTMQENLSHDPLAAQTIASGAINHLKARAGLSLDGIGNVTQAGYNKALAAISPKLADLVDPKTAEHLQILGNVARYTQEQPRGAYVNNSNTAVTQMANNAGNGIMHAIDAKTFGGASALKNVLDKNKLEAEAQKILAPGAGVNTLEFPVKGD